MLNRVLLPLILCVIYVTGWAAQPQTRFMDLQGQGHTLADYRGKWVIVNYWATWCPPCLDEIPELVEFHEQYSKDTAVVLGVNFEEPDPVYLKAFVDEYFITYPVLVADLDRPTPFGRLRGLPTTYIVSPAGELVDTRLGGVSKAYLESVITSGQQHTSKAGQ